VFTQYEIDLARRRMPTEKKMMTGLFKWKDIKRWHTTWQAWLSTYIVFSGDVALY
jgi:ACS family pantothenate transporter-like MFS transporter